MRKPNAIELRENFNCTTCQAKTRCEYWKGLRDPEHWICDWFTDVERGVSDKIKGKKVKL